MTASNKRDGLATLGLVLATVALRIAAVGNPLINLDEQFYLLVGARWWDGYLPFVDIMDRKPIGLFLVYALAATVGDGVIAYQVLAMACATGTTLIVYRMARRVAKPRTAVLAALAYPVWLNLLEGAGGQAPVFYNLLVVGAAALVMELPKAARGAPLLGRGVAVMLLIGVALQIKYTVLGEGIFLGLWLLWAAWRRQGAGAALGMGVVWVLVALVPTGVALLYYAAIGQIAPFLFANFTSILLRESPSAGELLVRLGEIIVVMLPVVAVGASGFSRAIRQRNADALFLIAWLAAACLSLLLFGTYFRHYALALVPPAAAAMALMQVRVRHLTIIILIIGAGVGQWMIHDIARERGGSQGAARLVAAMHDSRNCPYIYDGHPVLYHLGHFCLPSRLAFPSHLNFAPEAKALDIDTSAEEKRILVLRPDYILLKSPGYRHENRINRGLVEAATARNYRLVGRYPYSSKKQLLLYRLRPGLAPLPNAIAPSRP